MFGAVGAAIFAWVLRRIDYGSFFNALANANGAFVALVSVAILFEQWVGAAKWRLLLAGLGSTRLARVFAANMAASLANYVVPVAGSPIVRSWLVARCEGLRFASVLATIAVDRLVDGAAFLAFAAAAIVLVAMPQAGESLHAGLIAAAAGSAATLAALVALLAAFRRTVRAGGAGARRLLAWIPVRLRERAHGILDALAQGAGWPRTPARAAVIVLLALAVKALAATHLLYAGLALGVWLGIAQYVLLMVLLGFVHVLARFVRIPGGWLLAATFLLELFGVDRERALAMALIVQVSAIVSVTAAAAAAALAWFGAELRELKALYASGSLPGTPPQR
ncbi:MAG: lysylphosphatidylglycerol synthase transmembrane domain-containing protein [Burkholderiales bacterium]